MPIRPVIQKYSDRGSIKDIADGFTMNNEPPTALELRMRELYDVAVKTSNDQLKRELGFIVMSGSGDPAALPITLFRHREYINSLSKELRAGIDKQAEELSACFDTSPDLEQRQQRLKKSASMFAILQSSEMIKTASADSKVPAKRSFKRVR